MAVKIVVEGKADRKFLIDFIEEHFLSRLSAADFIVNGSNSLTENTSVENIRASIAGGNDVLLIFDADADYSATDDYLNEKKQLFGIGFDTFLFPNNREPGNLEVLLRAIVADDKEEVFNCIESYSTCLTALKAKHLRSFDAKAQIYVFVDSFEVGGDGKEDGRNYREKELWNLQHEYLQPLKQFLSPYFTPNDPS